MAKVVNLLSPSQRAKLLQIPDDFPEREIVRYYAVLPKSQGWMRDKPATAEVYPNRR